MEMVIIAAAEGGEEIRWVGYLVVLAAAAAISLGIRRVASAQGRFRLRRWVPAMHVAVWMSAVGLVVVGIAAHGFTTALLLVLLALAGVALAGMELLRDVAAGLVILSESKLAVGERIEVAGRRGEVISIGLRSVQLCDVDGIVHDIPHSELTGGPISHFSDVADAVCEFEMEFETDDEPEDVLRTVRLVAGLAPLASPKRRPQAHLKEPPRSGEPLKVQIRSYPFSADQRDAYRSDVVQRLQRRFS